MRLLRAAIFASVAAASLARIDHAPAQDLTCNNASLPNGSTPGEDVAGFGGPGAGGDASGVLEPTLALKACGFGVTGALGPSRAVTQWFSALTQGDRQKFLREARKVGVVDRNGQPFGPAEFDEMARHFDEAMTRQGMPDAEKLNLLEMMAEDAGIAVGNKAETHDAHGG
ncbi:MAG: hypothetical protein WAW96_01555 [Alphaproteobacteria bacterium]